MNCPDCTARVKGNFCSQCGRQLPYVAGESFPYGIRFPETVKKGAGYQAAVNAARGAPRYFERRMGGTLYHGALYGLEGVRQLVDLYTLVRKIFTGREEMIEHTLNGRTFTTGAVPWGCFAARVEKRDLGDWVLAHENVKCFSFFGCAYAHERQPRHFHMDKKEVFRHGLHGFFKCSAEDEGHFGDQWPLGLFQRLERTPFQLDKKRIREEVMRCIKRFSGHRCPLFSAQYLDAQLSALPDVLIPAHNPLWGVEQLYDNSAGVYLRCYGSEIIMTQQTVAKGPVLLGHNEIV